jgi:hypothetical protein
MRSGEKYGKHTVFLGAGFLAHQNAQHDGERGHLPERRRELLPGETARKRLGIPMFLGEVQEHVFFFSPLVFVLGVDTVC